MTPESANDNRPRPTITAQVLSLVVTLVWVLSIANLTGFFRP